MKAVCQQTQLEVTPKEATQQNNALFQENIARSQNEQALYNAWKIEASAKNNLVIKLNNVQMQLENLQKLYIELQSKYTGCDKGSTQNSPSKEKVQTEMQYFTDEDDLAEETEWIRKKIKNTKKRKMDKSPSPPQHSPKDPEKEQGQLKTKKVPQPPPIIVDGIENFNTLHELITDMMTGFQIKIINDTNIKINVKDGEQYQALTKALNEKEYSWHSYENKQNRAIKVMAVNLHHSCYPEEIVKDMRRRGYKLLEATRKLKYKTKQPLNMFMLSFRNDEDVNKIFGITDIMGIRVQIQPIRKSKLVPQCKRCQAYGHTQRYCAKEPRCVKCTGRHRTVECQKPKETTPKCVHCGEGHPASYRGCKVAKEMQKIKNKQLKKPSLPKQPQRSTQPKAPGATSIQQGNASKNKTYSQVITGKTIKSNERKTNEANSSIDKTLQQILEKLNKMDERISKLEYRAQGAIPKTKNG